MRSNELEADKKSAQYTAAAKSNSLDSASKALASLGQVLKSDPKLGQILHAPTLSSKDKSDIIAELEKHTGGQDKAKIVVNFMETLAENNRLGLLQGICEKFGQLMGASKGEMDLIITSAQVRIPARNTQKQVLTPTQKVDDKMIKRIEAAIAKSEYSQGKKLKVVTKVNPDILGGLIVEVGERSIDFSVSNKILKMNKMLQDAV